MIDDVGARISGGVPSSGLGVRLLAFDPLRLAAALSGVAVAVLVMFVELGLLDSILDAQSRIATLLRGDLVVMSAARTNFHVWGDVDRIRLNQISGFSGVDEVVPIYEGGMLLRNPPDRAVHRVIAFAFPADALPLNIGDAAAIKNVLKRTNAVLYDRLSRSIYGPIGPGSSIELDGKLFDVGGLVDIGPDILMDGAVVMSEGAWLSNDPRAQPIMGVVRLKQGADVGDVEQRLIRELPSDISVMTPREAYLREVQFTLRSAPIGIIFGIGLAAGLVIGAIVCYQILFNEIIDRAKEYATLRAMGFSDAFFHRIIYEQAALLAVGGLSIGLLAALVTFRFLAIATGMTMDIGLQTFISVALPTVAMSFLAATLAFRHLAAIEPADLY